MYIINAPALFSMFFSMIKPFYDPVTLAKIEVLGSDYQETLRQIIPEDELPEIYGKSSLLSVD